MSWACWEETVNPGVRRRDKLPPPPRELWAKRTSIGVSEDNTRARAASGEAPTVAHGKREHRGFVCWDDRKQKWAEGSVWRKAVRENRDCVVTGCLRPRQPWEQTRPR